MSQRGAANVKALLGTATDPRLPAGKLDLALMVDVYHEFEYPYEMLAAISRALKPGGRLVFVEYRANDPAVPIKALHTMTEAQVREEAALHHRETHAVDRDAVADGNVAQAQFARVDGEAQTALSRLDPADFADGGYDSGKHGENSTWLCPVSIPGWFGR